MRTLTALTTFTFLTTSSLAWAETGTPKPDAGFTQVPVEQAGTAHGTPESNAGQTPSGDGSTVVKQGTGTDEATVPAKPCDPASATCPGADTKQ